ncbi:DUF2513 domain-containing protein [Celeribacter sp.]|uniref:DUF2513 domain-containing protein n=1 Tax=Celeribacter sp. TaxID=1890673 RepID=UPI003A9408D0
MKRDDEYLRELLLKYEADDDYLFVVGGVMGPDEEELKEEYHVQLACDAGLMVETNRSTYRLSSQGHDYIDAVRSDTVWNKTKEGAAKVGGMTLGMMKDLAIAYVKQEAAEKLGVKF